MESLSGFLNIYLSNDRREYDSIYVEQLPSSASALRPGLYDFKEQSPDGLHAHNAGRSGKRI